MSASGLSALTSLPEPTVAKVLKLLVKEEIIESTRGASGGYTLERKPSDINVASILVAVDGPVALAACVEGSSDSCSYETCCPVKGRWDDVNLAVKQALESMSLADMLETPKSCGQNYNFIEGRA